MEFDRLASISEDTTTVFHVSVTNITLKSDDELVVGERRRQIRYKLKREDAFTGLSAAQHLQFLENVGVNTLNEVVELKTDTKIQLNVMGNKLETIVDTLNKPKKKKSKTSAIKRWYY